jgi:pimeloyl-ACP methyl ester carboxylesterase
MSEKATIVLAHGSWHGPWSWDRLTPLLLQRGFRVRAPMLPSSGPVSDPTADLSRDAEVIRREITRAGGPVLLVGHSSGGAAITLASAEHPTVIGLVYLCAFMPDTGESILTLVGPDLPPWIREHAPGLLDVDPAAAPQLFYGACDQQTIDWATPQRTKRAVATDAEVLAAAGWHERPSLYVICSRDETIPPDAQRQMATRATRTAELDTDHFPQLSMVEKVAELIAEAATQIPADGTTVGNRH